MNKKIISEIVIGAILLFAILIGGIIYQRNKHAGQLIDNDQQSIVNNKVQNKETIAGGVDSNGLYVDVADDIVMINMANKAAKEWQSDAQAYTVGMISDEELLNEHVVTFISENKKETRINIFLDLNGKIKEWSEKPREDLHNEYINSNNLKVSSSSAFQLCNGLAIKKKLDPNNYNRDLLLTYSKNKDIMGWAYSLTDKNSQGYTAVFECIVDASSGKILKNE